jgi:hypothetical protein
MAEVLTTMGGLVPFPLQLLGAMLVFCAPVTRRHHFALRLAGVVLAYSLLTLGLAAVSLSSGITATEEGTVVSSIFWCGLLFALMILLTWFLFELPWREAVYCGGCAYLMEHMVYCVRLLQTAALAPMEVEIGSPLYLADYVVVYFVIYRVFVRRMVQNGHYVTSAVDSLRLTVSVLTVVMVMSIMASRYQFETIHGVYALFCCVYALYGQLKQQNQLNLQTQLSLQQQLWAQQRAQYEMSRDTIDLVNRKCHDLKHQVAALRHIDDQAQKEAAIDSLTQGVMIYDAVVESGNQILDTVLTEKSFLCQQKEIKLTCMADGKRLNFMDVVDLYALFGNALDNAMEAVQKLPPEQRLIRLTVQQRVGLVLIQMENPCPQPLELVDGLPKSSKEANGYHGFGLKSMREIAERYHGLLTVQQQDGRFILRVTLPLSEQVTAQKQQTAATDGTF